MKPAWKLKPPHCSNSIEREVDRLVKLAITNILWWYCTSADGNKFEDVQAAQAVLHISKEAVLCDLQ